MPARTPKPTSGWRSARAIIGERVTHWRQKHYFQPPACVANCQESDKGCCRRDRLAR
jgi:hypothetical protein